MVLEAKKEALPLLLKPSEAFTAKRVTLEGSCNRKTRHAHQPSSQPRPPQLPRQPKHPQKSPPAQMHPTTPPSSGSQTTAPSKKTSLCKHDWENQIMQRLWKSRDSEAVCSCAGLKKRQRHLCDWLLVKSQLGTFAGCRAEPIIPAFVKLH